MAFEYNEKIFMKSIIDEYKTNANDDDESEITFEKHYSKLINKFNINDLFNHYSKEIDVEDAKRCYGNDYMKIKLGFVLHMKLINYIIDGSLDSDYDSDCNCDI